ncbi:hypothetical protein LSH36_555g03023 [Paralvinella palmiformis]|uniref:Uncharacterized protein n=1 Tax=Paralvinella palmiformis TaxID=53620 RepID=A0AAD9MXH3_9ANNE|nr:hypothetical protein LSH36_555g03023 [Paralvinella palmiformis]
MFSIRFFLEYFMIAPSWMRFLEMALLCACVVHPPCAAEAPPVDDSRKPNSTEQWHTDVRHGKNLFWVQNPANSSGSSRIVSIFGDPDSWVVNRTATTSYIRAPNNRWRFTGLTFNFRKRTLYWSDTGNKKIQGLVLTNDDVPFTIFDGISNGVHSLALDWLTNNIYWTDSLYNWIVMAPAVPDTTLFRIVINTDLDHPMGLVVHPFRGLLFWTDWGAVAKIEKSDTTGNSRRTIVDRDLVTPMGLALDTDGSRLYWVDRDRGTIESVDIFTSQRIIHFTVEDTQFVSLALYHVMYNY